MEKRLYRNEHNKTVAGVASGLADYLQIDLTIVRLIFVLSTIFIPTSGLLVYIILWIVLPVNNDPVARFNKFNDYFQKNQPNNNPFQSANPLANPIETAEQTKWNTENADGNFNDPFQPKKLKKNDDTSRTIGGLILLIVGFYFLLRQFDVLPEWFNIFRIYKLWPLAIVAIGISLIFKNQRKTEWDNFKKTTAEAQKETEQPIEEPTVIVEDKDTTTPTA